MGSNAGQDGTMVISSMDGLSTIYTRGREVFLGGVKAIDNGIGGCLMEDNNCGIKGN